MSKEIKSVFIINDETIAKRFNMLLSENLEVETDLRQGNSLSHLYTICVSPDDYQKTLEYGMEIIKINKWDEKIKWVNAYGELRPVSFINIMYCYLPKTRKISSLLELPEYCPIDIKEYIDKLKMYLNGRNINIKYESEDHAIEFLADGTLDEYELIKSQCEGFNHVVKNSPFIETIYLKKDGTLIKNNSNDDNKLNKEDSNIRSYFSESMFIDGLFRPEGSNIAPKTDTDQGMETGYKYGCRSWGVRNFNTSFSNIEEFNNSNVQGTFLVYEEKDYRYYWNNEKKEQTNCELMPFTMLDNGDFDSYICVSDDGVIVTTYVDVIRNIVGYDFDNKSVRDGLFNRLAHDDVSGEYKFVEYFRVIANGTRLLHYSDSSNFFEVYDLPQNWKIEDGIKNLDYPKVFDDVDYDQSDKDLEEINVILSIKNKQDKVRKK